MRRGYRARARRTPTKVPIRVPALMERLVGALEPGTRVVDDSVTSKAALLDQGWPRAEGCAT